ncbi:MAG: class I SAM-dependent methyltransferase [bacterium]|nr:class I SAM-dependent methyltransferase [bacterium]
MSKFFSYIWQEAMADNNHNIIGLLGVNKKAKAIDIGCGDGKLTLDFRDKLRSCKITGADGQDGRLLAATKNGVDEVIKVNLEEKWPLKNKSFDVVISNQVIEHMVNVDNFIKEIYRTLKPGGYCIISTENLSSWHNIFALILGYQDFSHHILQERHIGNPLAIHYGKKTASWSSKDHGGTDDSLFPHVKILTYRSLVEAFEINNLTFESGTGSGYYPLFGSLARLASKIDPYHSHFITAKFRKAD